MTKFQRKQVPVVDPEAEPAPELIAEAPMPTLVRYRLRETREAVQYTGSPIAGVTCTGNRDLHGCDQSRMALPHVHTIAPGGLTVLHPGDWILPVAGGPFSVLHDAEFRAYYEVPK